MFALFLLLALGCPGDDDSEPDPSTKTDDTGSVEDTGETTDDGSPGRLEGDTEAVDFLEGTIGVPEHRARIILNTGEAELGLSFTEPSAPFSITGADGAALPSTIAAGELLRIEIAFEPEDEASYEGSFTIQGDDPDATELTLTLSGEGIALQPVVQITENDDLTTEVSYNVAISDDGYKVVWQDESTRDWYRASTSGSTEPEAIEGPTSTDSGWYISEDASVIASYDDERFYANGVALDNCVSHPELDDQCLYGYPFELSADGSHIYFASSNPWDCTAVNDYEDQWQWECDINGGWHDSDEYLWKIATTGGEPELVTDLGEGYIWDLAISRDELSYAYTDSTYNRVVYQREGSEPVTLYDGGLGACDEPGSLLMSRDGTTLVVGFECYDRYERWVTAMATDGSWTHEHRDFVYNQGDIRLRDIADDGQLFTYQVNDTITLGDTRGCWRQDGVLSEDMNVNIDGGIDGFGQLMAFTAAARDDEGDWGPTQVWVAEVTLEGGITVNSTGDASDEDLEECACSTGATTDDGDPECTLRAALETAPSWGTPEGTLTRIQFEFSGSEPSTIAVSSELPALQSWTAIEGSTAEAGRVVIDGSALVGAESGILLDESYTYIGGLTIRGFPQDGVYVTHSDDGGHSQVHGVSLEDNGRYGLYAGGSAGATGTVRLSGNLTGGAYVGGDAFFVTDHLEVVDNGGDGVSILGSGPSWAKNIEARANAGHGISASSSLLATNGVYENNGGDGILAGVTTAGLIWAEGNCGDGVSASQLVLADNAYLRDNGVDEGCEGSGLAISSGLAQAGDRIEATGNGGHGIQLGSDSSKLANSLGEGVLVTNNGGSGILSGRDLSIDGASVSDNGDDGLRVTGAISATWLEVLRNGATGVAATSLELDEGKVCDNGGPELEVESSELGDEVEICDE